MIRWVPGDVELGRGDGIHLEISGRAAWLLPFRRRFQNLGERRIVGGDSSLDELLNFYFVHPPPPSIQLARSDT